MPTFGKTSIGVNSSVFADIGNEYIVGSGFSIAEFGIAQSITVALKRAAAGSNNIKCAIYKASDYSLVGETDEVSTALTTSFDWYTFPFSTKPALQAGTTYILVVWADYTTQTISIAYDEGATATYFEWYIYGSFPNPAGFDRGSNADYSIYCTYATVGIASRRLMVGVGL